MNANTPTISLRISGHKTGGDRFNAAWGIVSKDDAIKFVDALMLTEGSTMTIGIFELTFQTPQMPDHCPLKTNKYDGYAVTISTDSSYVDFVAVRDHVVIAAAKS